KKFQASAKRAGVELSDEKAQFAVSEYRRTHHMVTRLWREADGVLIDLHQWQRDVKWHGLTIDDGRLVHPNGTWLDYRSLRWQEGEWRLYGRNDQWSKMYGSKLIENIVQWLSRIVTAEAMVDFDRAGYPVVGMAHDDVWLLVPDNDLGAAKIIPEIMSETPSWAPGLPLAAECEISKTYA